jgi:hypothetical protein
MRPRRSPIGVFAPIVVLLVALVLVGIVSPLMTSPALATHGPGAFSAEPLPEAALST